MAGPIETAYVLIKTRIEVDPAKGDIVAAFRGDIRKLETDLDQLEGAAARAGSVISKQLGNLRVALDVAPALSGMTKVERATDEVTTSLRALQSREVSLQTQAASKNIDRLDTAVANLGRTFDVIDNEEIDFNVTGAKTQLQALDTAIRDVVAQIENTKKIRFVTQTEESVQELDRLRTIVGEAQTALAKIATSRVHVKVEDLELDNLIAKLATLKTRASDIDVKIDPKNMNAVSRGVERLNVNLNDFGDQFRNIAFRAVSYLAVGQAMSAFQRMISFGLEAAGEIQTVTVGLNRLFADMAELGSTAADFIGELRSVALTTPFEFIDLADTSRRLVQLGGSSDLALERMKSLADAGAAVGASSEDINGVVRALSQMAAKGRINLQDLNQVAERLPNFQRQLQLQGVIQELRDMGSPLADTVNSFDDLRKAGVPIETVVNGIFRGLKDIPGAAGAAAAQARTLEGALSNLKDFAQFEFATAFKEAGITLSTELNSAFANLTGGVQDASSDLADSIREVIGAFGVALDDALPEVLDFFKGFSTELAGLADAIGNIVESFASGFAGEFFSGLIDGLSGVINMATALNDLMGTILPAGISEGLGQVGAELIALSRLGVPAFAPFQHAINETMLSMKLFQGSAISMRQAISSIGTAFAGAGVATVGLVALTVTMNRMADASRRNREAEQSINGMTQALEELGSQADPLEAVLKVLDDVGEGIKLGELEEQFDSLTAPEVRAQLGLTRKEFQGLVQDLAALAATTDGSVQGGAGADLFKALGVDQFGENTNAIRNIEVLADQFAAASEAAFDTAIETKRFGLVLPHTSKRISDAAEASGDYAEGLQQLDEANQQAAEQGFARLVDQLNLSESEARGVIRTFTDAETGTMDWVGALGELTRQSMAVDDALLDLQDRAPQIVDLADSFKVAALEGDGFRGDLIELSRQMAYANLSAEELDAIVRRLGTSFTGEELKVRIDGIVESVAKFTEVFANIIPGFDDLQSEADSFSLQGFIDELLKIERAQQEVVGNINGIIDKFGELGVQAIQAVIDSGVSPEQAALLFQGLVDAAPSKLQELVDAAAAVGDQGAHELATRLTAWGIDQETANAIAGVDKFIKSGQDAAAGFEAGFGGMRPGITAGLEEEAARWANRPAALPEVDIEKATAEASSAGAQISEAFKTSVAEGVGTTFEEAGAKVSAEVSKLGSGNSDAAIASGKTIATGLILGLNTGLLKLDDEINQKIKALSGGTAATSRRAGKTIAEGIVGGIRPVLREELHGVFEALADRFIEFGQQLEAIGAQEGEDAAQAFGESFSALDEFAQASMGSALNAVRAGSVALIAQSAATGLLSAAAFGAGFNLAPRVRIASAAAIQALNSSSLRNLAFASGIQVGFNFGRGVGVGITLSYGAVIASAIRLVNVAKAAAVAAAGISSPSKVFMSLGEQIGEGFAIGMENAYPRILKASAGMATAASSLGASSVPTSVGGGGAGIERITRRALSTVGSGPSAAAAVGTPPGTGTVHHHIHHWNITAPTDDPEGFANRVATRIERRLEG